MAIRNGSICSFHQNRYMRILLLNSWQRDLEKSNLVLEKEKGSHKVLSEFTHGVLSKYTHEQLATIISGDEL